MANTLFDIALDVERETKGAVRYAERGNADTHKVGTIYFRKTAFKDGKWPQSIKVTVALDKSAAST